MIDFHMKALALRSSLETVNYTVDVCVTVCTDTGMTTKYQTNTSNQYTQIESIQSVPSVDEPRYDKLGNLLQDTRNTYTWDADIHLMSVETKSNDQLGTKNQEQRTVFKYDALHRRVARTESDTQTSTFFVHDGWNVISEHAAPANLKSAISYLKSPSARHVWGEDLSGSAQGAGGIGGLLASTHSSSSTKNDEQRTKNWLHYDSNGNVILLSDAGGRESARYQYDAFGKTILAHGSAANLNRYQFSTKPIEEVSGLAFYGYRYYSPELGRWPSRDPIGENGGMNLFGMIRNDTLNQIDLLGLEEYSNNLQMAGEGSINLDLGLSIDVTVDYNAQTVTVQNAVPTGKVNTSWNAIVLSTTVGISTDAGSSAKAWISVPAIFENKGQQSGIPYKEVKYSLNGSYAVKLTMTNQTEIGVSVPVIGTEFSVGGGKSVTNSIKVKASSTEFVHVKPNPCSL